VRAGWGLTGPLVARGNWILRERHLVNEPDWQVG